MSNIEHPLTHAESVAMAEAEQQHIQRKQLRAAITQESGDIKSILGTTTDGMHLLLLAFSQMTVALHQANSLAAVRQAAALFYPVATDLLDKVEAQQVQLPYQVKGMEAALSDIEHRATTVAKILTKNG